MSVARNPLDERQLEELLAAATQQDHETEFIVRTLCHTGMRASELAHMRASWCDWHNDQIHVPAFEDCDCSDCRTKAARSKSRTVEEYWRPKSDAGVRAIPIDVDVDTYRLIRDFFKRNEAVGLSRKTIWERVRGMEDHVSFDREIGPHHLRHTFGTTIAYNTEDLQYVKQVMGHADITSSQWYLRYTGSQLSERAMGSLG